MPKKTFSIKLKDGKHSLYFDDWAFYQFEDVEGKPITAVNTSDIGIKTLTHIVWSGLLHNYDEEPTIKEIAKLIPIRDFADVLETATDAISDAFGEIDEEAEAKNVKAGPGTGKSGSE